MRSCDDDDDELDDDDDEAGSTVFCGPDLFKFIDLGRDRKNEGKTKTIRSFRSFRFIYNEFYRKKVSVLVDYGTKSEKNIPNFIPQFLL